MVSSKAIFLSNYSGDGGDNYMAICFILHVLLLKGDHPKDLELYLDPTTIKDSEPTA